MQSAGGPLHGAAAIASIQLVDGLHQALPAVLLLHAHRHHQVGLKGVGALQVLHQHARFGQLPVRSEDPLHQGKRGLQQGGGVVAGQIEACTGGLAVKGWNERTGAGVHREGSGALTLLAQFFGGAHHVGGDGLAQFLQRGDRSAEAAADACFLLRCRRQFQRQAGMTPQFPLQPQTHHTAFGPQLSAGHVPQQAGVAHTAQPAPAGQLAADAPDVFDRNRLQPAIGVIAVPQVKHAGMGGNLFGQAVGQLRLPLAGPYADGDRQTQILAQPGPQRPGPVLQVAMAWSADASEGFVDGIDLQLFAVEFQQAHHPLAHVGIEGVVGTAHHHVLALQLPACLEIRRAHGDAEGTGFGAAGHDAAVIVGEHHHGPADQAGIKALFTGGIEVVAVDQDGGLAHVRGDGSHGWPHPRSALHRNGAAPGLGRRDWPLPDAGDRGGG